MSSKKPSNPRTSATSAPDGSRRARLQAEQEKAARERKVRNGITFGVIGVLVVVLIGVVTWVVVSAARTADTPTGTGGATNADYAVVVGAADAPVTVTVFQDFMCPYCGEFERTNGTDLEALVSDGTVRLEIHAMSFLDRYSQNTQFSTRAANAFVTVAKAEPDKVLAFNAAMYDNQPAENTPGLSDEQIVAIAQSVGVSSSVTDTFTQLTNTTFVSEGTNAAFAAGITGTPTIWINGEPFSGNYLQAGEVKSAVLAAAASSAAGPATAEPTPSA